MPENNQDFWLIFDNAIAEAVSEWAEANPETIEEAISRLAIFATTQKTARGSAPYFLLISETILVSRHPERAARVALEILRPIRGEVQETEEPE